MAQEKVNGQQRQPLADSEWSYRLDASEEGRDLKRVPVLRIY